MKISEFSYRNLLSYGNILQKIEFNDEPRLILVEGENGAGKSSIKEALTVSIYGRSAIRKMKDVPNWINRNAFTQIKFMTTSGEHIVISRGIDPNFSDIELNGAKFNLPDKRKVDEFVEEELVKIPFSVFVF
jgi:DNA repair exonuclease SbcCD ATPase subunit